MAEPFDPKNDYLLPIGVFADKLLGGDISPYTRDHVADVQALLVVFDKYLLASTTELTPDEGKKFKDDFLFKNMHRDAGDLKNELMDTVPAEVDVTQEIEEARALVDSGQGVPNVPPFGMILAKRLTSYTVNHCLQVQAGLRSIALLEKWPGHEKVVPARVFPNDPFTLQIAQSVMNDVLQKTFSDEEKLAANEVAILAIRDAREALMLDGKTNAIEVIDDFLVEAIHDFPGDQDKLATVSYYDAHKNYQYVIQGTDNSGPGLKGPAPL